MRIDVYLAQHQRVKSRAQAQDYIEAGLVTCNGILVKKASEQVEESDVIALLSPSIEYASRAGLKLHYALERFQVSLAQRIVLDVGASTGGFTDVALQQGAQKVYAVDVGHDQLIERLRQDVRVVNYEGMHAKHLLPEHFPQKPDFVVMDVSFISVTLLVPALIPLVEEDAQWIVLIKPQFEAGKKEVGKKGIVKDRKVHQRVLQEMQTFFANHQLYLYDAMRSEVVGRDGNQEYIFYLGRKPKLCNVSFKELTTKVT
ncbi:MAG: TlyA family RNA methyltransferase [Erysipelotrichaceae bacterium]